MGEQRYEEPAADERPETAEERLDREQSEAEAEDEDESGL
jgi:hypothetical protein